MSKKFGTYSIVLVVLLAVILLLFTGNEKNDKYVDQRVSLKRGDKIPYGTHIAYRNLKYLFPGAVIESEKKAPGNWSQLSSEESGQALIIITGQFNADETEMKHLLSFVGSGNDLFISARTVSYSVREMLGFRINTSDIEDLDIEPTGGDSLHLFVKSPPYREQVGYHYRGKILDASFREVDEKIMEILGENEQRLPDFIRLRAGKGTIFIHLAPLAFSNYFLLQDTNSAYYEKLMSVFSPGIKKLVWDEYFLNKKFLEEDRKKNGWFNVLSQYPALKAALITGMLTLLIYVLIEMRRKQRIIPVVATPGNDSLDFVKTIGRLYYEKGDHRNLCHKMSSYFLEHIRNKYKIATGLLDEEFIKALGYKSGVPEEEIRKIVDSILHVSGSHTVEQEQLADFHSLLERFYRKT